MELRRHQLVYKVNKNYKAFGFFIIWIFFNLIALSGFSKTVDQVMKSIEADVLQRAPELFKYVSNEKLKYLVVVYKKERSLEVWTDTDAPEFIRAFPMTGFSGSLGPKNQEGDRQIPEGVYKIIDYNPNSSYHLSLKINYPNSLDKKRAKANRIKKPGGLIFIHGDRVTIGCIPLGDKPIEDFFYFVRKIGKKNMKLVIAPQKNMKKFDESPYSKGSMDRSLIQQKYELIRKETNRVYVEPAKEPSTLNKLKRRMIEKVERFW